jgi:hypothetical protein
MKRVLSRALLVGLLASSSVALAAKPVAKPPKTVAERLPESARAHFDKGFVLYEAGDYDGALAAFRAAYDESREPRVLRNMAVCEKNLRRYSRALSLLERQLAEATDLEPKLREKIQSELEILRGLTAPLVIEGPAGAEIFVDGASIGTLPLREGTRLDVGDRQIVARAKGLRDDARTVTVVGERPVRIELAMVAATARLRVRAGAVEGATVRIDGVVVGRTPWEGDVAPGSHRISVAAPGRREAREERIVEPGASTIDLELAPLEGRLIVEADDPSAVVSIDGRIVGTGRFDGALPLGRHAVLVRAGDRVLFDQSVEIAEGQRNVRVRSDGGTTWPWWVAGGAAVVAAGVGSYFLFRPRDSVAEPAPGTIAPGVLRLP